MNKWIGIGRLVRDPELSYGGDNAISTAKFTLAVDRRFVKKDDPNAQTADFIRCVCFGKMAENCEKYWHKGMKAVVTGRIQTGKYVNKDGQTVYTTDIAVEDLEFGESKKASEANGETTSPTQTGGFSGGYQNPNQSYMNIPEGTNEVLPFS